MPHQNTNGRVLAFCHYKCRHFKTEKCFRLITNPTRILPYDVFQCQIACLDFRLSSLTECGPFCTASVLILHPPKNGLDTRDTLKAGARREVTDKGPEEGRSRGVSILHHALPSQYFWPLVFCLVLSLADVPLQLAKASTTDGTCAPVFPVQSGEQ